MRPVPSEPPTTRVRPRGVLINRDVAKSSTDPVKEGATETKRNGGRCYPAFSFLLPTHCIVARSLCRSRGISLPIPTLVARGDAPLSIFHTLSTCGFSRRVARRCVRKEVRDEGSASAVGTLDVGWKGVFSARPYRLTLHCSGRLGCKGNADLYNMCCFSSSGRNFRIVERIIVANN